LKKPIIEFKHVSKVFEDSGTTVLKDISFELEEGKFYTLLGASGSGKSTILNIIAGLLDASSGDIYLDGQRINDVPTNKRDVHTVFQSYALFPHMTVFENVAFPLKLRKVDKSEIERRVTEALQMVRLSGYEKRSIQKLSGGQRQRVAIARAMVKKPDILLCDELTGALDTKSSKDVLQRVQKMNDTYKTTVVIITHNLNIAGMADRIIKISDGKVVSNQKNADKKRVEGMEL
jgi:spermidine/putrescine transport system ATP-binding protein